MLQLTLQDNKTLICQSPPHRQEPGSSVQALQLGPGKHGRRCVCPVGENLVHVGGPPQRAVVHQEGDAIVAADETGRQL